MDFKETINEYPHLTFNQIIEKISKYKIVSFDIFDTLLKRDVCAEADVFDLVERQYNQEHMEKISGFKKVRIEAEKAARSCSLKEEVSLTDIYEFLTKTNKNFEDAILDLMKIEESIEFEISCPNPIIKKVYEHCLQQNKRIYIISDMYLSKSMVEKMLKKNGFTRFEALYLSSEEGMQKRSSRLFSHVLMTENINSNEIVHIGDNKKADWIAAKKVGLHVINIAKNISNSKYLKKTSDLDEGIVYSFVNNRIPFIAERNKSIGYEVYGPLLYSFSKWLSERLDNKKTILFFSRDCYLVKPAYEELIKENKNTIYFLGSRKSLIVPALYRDTSLDHVSKLIKSESARMTIGGLLGKLGLQPQKFESKICNFSLTLESVIHRDHLSENRAFVAFYSSIENEVRKNAEMEYIGFLEYFSSLNCTDEIQIVDIGWRCTMQYCLKNLLPEKYKLHGYYLGVREDAFILNNEYTGFFLNGELDEEKKIFLASMTALIEIFFSAPHGSIDGYREDGSVVYGAYECDNDDSSCLVKEIQEGSFKFVKDFSNHPISGLARGNSEMLFRGLKQLGTVPQKEELDVFGNFPFHMGAGIVKAAYPDSIMCYVVNPKKFLYDFSNSNWKVAFLRKTLKIKLPYYKLFELLYRHKG